ncbi:MAG: HNH endonuclease [Streptosporangiaceae bacterium]
MFAAIWPPADVAASPAEPAGVPLERVEAQICELAGHLAAATCRFLVLLGDFDARRGWASWEMGSCARWLSWKCQMSYAKVRALTRITAPHSEAGLAELAGPMTASQLERFARAHRQVTRADDAAARVRRRLTWRAEEDGSLSGTFRLPPLAGAVLLTALRAACAGLAGDPPGGVSAETPSLAQQQADALALLAESALHRLDPGAPGERYQVVVHVDAQVLADPDQPGQSVLDGGARVSEETSQRLACDASRVVMRHDDRGRLVEIGARTRTIPPALRRALHHRDRSCRFPSCGVRFGQGHHLRHWAHGGPTTLSNLALLCRRHHRAVHEEGYQVARGPDGALRFRRPDGRPLPEVPAPARVPEKPVEALRIAHESRGLRLDARTACAGWLGERLDVGWAIDVLHPLAQGARPWPPSEQRPPGELANIEEGSSPA